ncbi:MAG TPA: NADH-quinone oxidoreductase subunit C [Gallionella sp.]
MAEELNKLGESLHEIFTGKVVSLENRLGELTLVIDAADILEVLTRLRDDAKFRFTQLIDLCGMDYSAYGSEISDGGVYLAADTKAFANRFAVVYHLLSVEHNQRLRVKAFAKDDDMPVLDSAIDVWSSANWFEREAFDLYGIIFTGHPDLRRILTDYGFVGNPFRKDFPLSGHVEMRYDPAQQRVVYQPVSIEPREVTPRIRREETYGCN